MAARQPGGILAPVATIFGDDGELDLAALSGNLGVYAESELDGVVLLGSNGEFATLDPGEREAVVETGVEAIGGRRVVMAGTGAESTRRTIEQTRHAAAAGVDFALVITPHYYKTRYDRMAMVRHYQTVAEASLIPILVYVMAAYTGLDLPTATIAELSRHPNIVGIKDSGGHAVKIADMLATVEPGFSVLAGSGRVPSASYAFSALTPSWMSSVASPPSSTMRSGPSEPGHASICSVHHQYSSRVSPFQAKTAAESRAMTAAAWSWVEKMLHEHQRTSAPSAVSVSMSTAVWMVMCSEPLICAPLSGCEGPNS